MAGCWGRSWPESIGIAATGNCAWNCSAAPNFPPGSDWILGLTPHLRYNFATGTRWIPFLDGGAGLTATGIGRPDLSSTFEFNIQGGVGVHWLMSDHWALTAEARYFHVSDAELTSPNYGVNGVMGMVGITRFF